jgi:hypothetical protein
LWCEKRNTTRRLNDVCHGDLRKEPLRAQRKPIENQRIKHRTCLLGGANYSSAWQGNKLFQYVSIRVFLKKKSGSLIRRRTVSECIKNSDSPPHPHERNSSSRETGTARAGVQTPDRTELYLTMQSRNNPPP